MYFIMIRELSATRARGPLFCLEHNAVRMRSTTVTRDSSESATSAKHQHVLSWTDLEYSVGITLHRGMCRRAVQSRKMVLSNLTGFVRSGQMCALMGPSGSGKSSLLSVLAGHMPARGRLERGSVQINGESLDKGLRRMAGYVFQDDLLLPALTVRETVEFAAKLRMPQALGHDARQARVESTLEQLGLLGCADVLIGSEKQRGVSGGERKRARRSQSSLWLAPRCSSWTSPRRDWTRRLLCFSYEHCAALPSAEC